MRCRRRRPCGRPCKGTGKCGKTVGMILIAAGVIILSVFVLPHKVLLVIAAIALIAAGCFLA